MHLYVCVCISSGDVFMLLCWYNVNLKILVCQIFGSAANRLSDLFLMFYTSETQATVHFLRESVVWVRGWVAHTNRLLHAPSPMNIRCLTALCSADTAALASHGLTPPATHYNSTRTHAHTHATTHRRKYQHDSNSTRQYANTEATCNKINPVTELK